MKFFSLFKKPKKEDMFDIFPDGILIVSMDGKILDANLKAQVIFETSKVELIGAFFSHYIQGGSVLLNKLVGQETSVMTKVLNIPAEEDKFVEVAASKGEEDKVYVSVKDVTQNYKVQSMVNGEYEIAKKIIDEKNSYLKSISFELFSVLNSVVNFSKALEGGVGGKLNDKQNKYVTIINRNSNELYYDLKRLFQYFELESELYSYEYKRFDLGDLMTSVARSYEILFAKKKINFSYDLSTFLTRSCNSDSNAVETFVKALLELSLKYTDIGSISMNVGNPPLEFLESKGFNVEDENIKKQYAMFEIKDTGFVIPDDVLERIFDFYYLNENMTKKLISAKMTIALVYKFVKDLKGDMWVYSNSNQGTLYCILLPMDKA